MSENAAEKNACLAVLPDELPDLAEGNRLAVARALGRELAEVYDSAIAFFQREYGITATEADKRLHDLPSMESLQERIPRTPVKEISNWQLTLLAELDPDLLAVTWERIEQQAREDLDSGFRAARTLEHYANPIDRAYFLAVLTGFIETWQPSNAIERRLLEQLAQIHEAWEFWLNRHLDYAQFEAIVEKTAYDSSRRLQTARISTAQAIEQSQNMADRFQRMFVRTLRALRDLRRYGAPVTIANASQVNIAGQQVNMVAPEPD